MLLVDTPDYAGVVLPANARSAPVEGHQLSVTQQFVYDNIDILTDASASSFQISTTLSLLDDSDLE